MRRLLVLVGVVLLLVVGAAVALGQGDESEPTVETVTAVVDGETRSVTVTFVATGVLSVVVGPAPVTETFAVTATEWLETVADTFWYVGPTEKIDIDERNGQLDELLELTESVAYPGRYTPFVRQFRFTIRTCSDWLNFHSNMTTQKDNGGIFMVGAYMSERRACFNRYQEAYVEMERIKAAE